MIGGASVEAQGGTQGFGNSFTRARTRKLPSPVAQPISGMEEIWGMQPWVLSNARMGSMPLSCHPGDFFFRLPGATFPCGTGHEWKITGSQRSSPNCASPA